MHRVIFGVSAVCLIAGGTRVAAQSPAAAAWLVGAASVLAVGIGVAVNGRWHAGRWRRGWWLLWAALAARAGAAVVEVLSPVGWDVFPSWAHLLHFAGAVAAVAGVDQLMRHRHPGRAADVLFESAVAATLTALAAWLVGIEPSTPLPAGDAAHLFSLALVGLGVAAVWTTVRLIWLTEDHPPAYRYLAAGLLCLLTVDAASAGSLVADWTFASLYQSALELWASVLWAAGALHPSLRGSFDPVPSRPENLRRTRTAMVMAAALLGPVLAAVQVLRGSSLRFGVVLVAAGLVPLLVIAELMRQVRERATREYLAQHDALTGLPNRVLFHDRLEIALAHARRSGRRAAVMFLDLDRFKEVNDSLGHDVGNQLLQGVARRLRRCLREHDTVARLGGDEFTILLTEVDDADACSVVADKVLRAFREPFAVTGRQLFAGASIGVAIYPDDGIDAETLLKNADTAMYRAKARGRSSYELYTKDMSARAEVRHSLESSLHRAIERGELALHYQPKVRRLDGRVLGVEALVRWEHPRLGSIPPSAFIPLAEESGLILPLGEWVLTEACRQAAEWSGAGLTRMTVAVNVSARQFTHEPLEDIVRRVLDESGLDPALLELELTESVFLRDLNAVNNVMQRLHHMGVGCSIDDFGTGFSGLTYLHRMPIRALKIDRSFVRDIHPGVDAPLVSAMISMAKSLAIGVVAEGVETEAQAQFLVDHGCDEMQGFLFSRPLPAGDLERLLMTEQGFLRGMPAAPLAGRAPLAAAAGPTLDRGALVALLETACTQGESFAVDPGLVDAVLVALRDDQLAATVRQWGSASLPVRLAAGTFAGLIPLSGGLAAADALPGPAQEFALRAFTSVGVELPHVDRVPRGPVVLAAPPVAPHPSEQRGGGGGRGDHGRLPAGPSFVALPLPLEDGGADLTEAPPTDPGPPPARPRRRSPVRTVDRQRPAPAIDHAPSPVDVSVPGSAPANDPAPPAHEPPVTPARDGVPPGQDDTPPARGAQPGNGEVGPGNGGAEPGNGGGVGPSNGGFVPPGVGGVVPGSGVGPSDGGGVGRGNGGGAQPGNGGGGGAEPGKGGVVPGGGVGPGNGGGAQPGNGGGTGPSNGGAAGPGNGGGAQPRNGGDAGPDNGGVGSGNGGGAGPGNGDGAQPGNGGGVGPENGSGAQPGYGGGVGPENGSGAQPGYHGGVGPGNGGAQPGNGGAGAGPGGGGGGEQGNDGAAPSGNGGVRPGSGGGAEQGNDGAAPSGNGGVPPGSGGGAEPGNDGAAQSGNGGVGLGEQR